MKEKITNGPNIKKRIFIKSIVFVVIVLIVFIVAKRVGLCAETVPASISAISSEWLTFCHNNNIDLTQYNSNNCHLIVEYSPNGSFNRQNVNIILLTDASTYTIDVSSSRVDYTHGIWLQLVSQDANVNSFYPNYTQSSTNKSGNVYFGGNHRYLVNSQYIQNSSNIFVDLVGLQYLEYFGIAEYVVIPDFSNPDLIEGIGHHVGNTYLQLLNGELNNEESLPEQNGHYQGAQNSIISNLPTSSDNDTSLLGKITNLISSVVSNTSNFFGNFWGNLFNQLSFSADYMLSKIGGFFSGIYDYFDSFLASIMSKFDSVISAINSFNNQTNTTWDDVVDTYTDSSIYGVTHSIFELYSLTDDYFEVDAITTPTFTFSLADTPLSSAGSFTLDFSWYESIRDKYILIFMGIVSAVFVWHCVRSIPSLISGSQGLKEV